MKKFKYILLIILTCVVTLNAKLVLKPATVRIQQQAKLVSKGNEIILYGLQLTNQLQSYYLIDYFNGESWFEIPNLFIDNDNIDTLRFDITENNILFDPFGNLLLCGETNGYYKWNGNNLKKFQIDDELKSKRKYNSIALDSLGNIWLTTKIILEKQPLYENSYSELIKFDGKDYRIIADTKGKKGNFGFTKMFVSSDNRLFVISSEINDNLLIISPDEEIQINTIPTPHKIIDSLRFEQRLAKFTNIFEDKKNNIWFSLSSNDPRDPGIVILRADNNWDVLTEHNNYPLRFSNKGFSGRDSLFMECFTVSEDLNGNIWVGGTGFLNYIDENDMLVTPNIEEFLNKSTFYSREIITDIGKEAPPSQVDFLSSSDSISTIIIELFNRDWTTKHTMGKIGENGGRVESMTTTEDGSIWIAFTHIGVLRYQPTKTTVENILVSQEVNLYPQPVTSADKLINIEFENLNYVSNINIYNINGKLIQRNNFDSQLYSKIEMRLDNDDFIAGTYFAAIELKDRTIFRKFIIN